VLSGIWLIIIGVWQIVEAFILRSHAHELLEATG
jgi:uncharacterized membrane protein HdeD (DUF308 family)